MFIFYLVILISIILGVSPQSCTTAGRYPIGGTNCKSYMHCTVSGTTLIQTNFTCPSTSVFNPRLQQCVSGTSYTCVDTICEQRGPLQPDFTLYYGDPNDTTNKMYFTCHFQNGRWTPIDGVCGINQCFLYDQATTYRQGCCTSDLTTCGPAAVVNCRP